MMGEIAPITINVYTNCTVFVNVFKVTGAISPFIVNIYTNGSVYTNKCYKPPLEKKVFHFHGEFSWRIFRKINEKSGKVNI